VGICSANLAPDNYDTWSNGRLSIEFLSVDASVKIDYSPWKWQPASSGDFVETPIYPAGPPNKSIWNHSRGESPLMTITKQQTAKE